MSTTLNLIRGVTLGGWLLAERFITPYLFAVTDCDIRGDFRSYPGQLGVPRNAKYHTFPDSNFEYDPVSNITIWDDMECRPVSPYPVDVYTLLQSFESRNIGREYLRRHWANFVSREDLVEMKGFGISHVRVPIGHWILGDISDEEPYVDGEWQYFVQLCRWAREIGLEVWPVVSSVPGSETSGVSGWYTNAKNVERSVNVVKNLVDAIKRDGLEDVVTGVGPLDMDESNGDSESMAIIRQFWNDSLALVRRAFPNMAVFIGDSSNATSWNDGYWLDPKTYHDTYLDSHYFQMPSPPQRELSPRQHIAYVCRSNTRATQACCYEDHANQNNTTPSKGIRRIIGAWSVAFDTLPSSKLTLLMHNIATTGIATDFNRKIPIPRQVFLKNFAKAQIVTYEDTTTAKGWFYSNFKMEGGAFAEWDFLRGVRDKWMPPLPSSPTTPARADYGSCEEILQQTNDSMSIIHPFPPITSDQMTAWDAIDDDVVVSHGETLIPPPVHQELNNPVDNLPSLSLSPTTASSQPGTSQPTQPDNNDPPTTQPPNNTSSFVGHHTTFVVFVSFVLSATAWIRLKRFCFSSDYEIIPASSMELSV